MHTSSRWSNARLFNTLQPNNGFTLLEVLVFIVVLSVALTALINVYRGAVLSTVDPVIRIKALEKSQALMDEILARKYDENTPVGGVPACDSALGNPCAGIVPDGDYDDVGDFNGFSDSSEAGFTLSASVTLAGADLGIANTNARLVVVTGSMPNGDAVNISAYKVNF